MRLTGLLLPAMRLVSVPARAHHWEHVRQQWQAPVLRALPWTTMTFDQIEKKLRSLKDPELGDDPLERIATWVTELRAALPALRERLDLEIERLERQPGVSGSPRDFGRVASDHPAGSWLLRRRAGKLSPDHLGCSKPEELLTLARALGLPLTPEPLR